MDKVVHVEGLEDRVDCCIQLACLFSRFTLVFCKIFGVLFCEIFGHIFVGIFTHTEKYKLWMLLIKFHF